MTKITLRKISQSVIGSGIKAYSLSKLRMSVVSKRLSSDMCGHIVRKAKKQCIPKNFEIHVDDLTDANDLFTKISSGKDTVREMNRNILSKQTALSFN